MLDLAENPRAVAGDNNPPEPTPYEAMKIHIEDLFATAKDFLDGEKVTTQAMADAVDRIKAEALKAEKDGDLLRKEEAKPFDDGKKAVQEKWNPLVNEKTGKCRLIIETCRKAVQPFLIAEQAKKDAIAKAAADEAAKLALEAQAKYAAAPADNITARADAEDALAAAKSAISFASFAAKDTAKAKGSEGRATGLISVWTATITDRRTALNHYIKQDPEAFTEVIQRLANAEARSGPRTAAGITFTETKAAR